MESLLRIADAGHNVLVLCAPGSLDGTNWMRLADVAPRAQLGSASSGVVGTQTAIGAAMRRKRFRARQPLPSSLRRIGIKYVAGPRSLAELLCHLTCAQDSPSLPAAVAVLDIAALTRSHAPATSAWQRISTVFSMLVTGCQRPWRGIDFHPAAGPEPVVAGATRVAALISRTRRQRWGAAGIKAGHEDGDKGGDGDTDGGGGRAVVSTLHDDNAPRCPSESRLSLLRALRGRPRDPAPLPPGDAPSLAESKPSGPEAALALAAGRVLSPGGAAVDTPATTAGAGPAGTAPEAVRHAVASRQCLLLVSSAGALDGADDAVSEHARLTLQAVRRWRPLEVQLCDPARAASGPAGSADADSSGCGGLTQLPLSAGVGGSGASDEAELRVSARPSGRAYRVVVRGAGGGERSRWDVEQLGESVVVARVGK